jgi:uncharacterized protein YecE (DUF72 family)
MQFFVGASGYSYKEWKGSFYPEKLPAKSMLSFYAGHFSTVEINNTFYRLPKESVVESWAAEVPDGFRFVFKAWNRLTHIKRLKDVEEPLELFLNVVSSAGDRLGPLLFQLPPNLKKDIARLDAFLTLVGRRATVAFEFRHETWFDDEVYDCLRKHSCALCFADGEDIPGSQLVSTTDWGYVRLRRVEYTDNDLRKWIERLRSHDWNTAYVFFKHEDTGTGPKLARRFLELAATSPKKKPKAKKKG